MSAVKVRSALETALAAMSPALSTAFENAPFTPTVGTPYQRATLLLAQPANDEFSSTYREEGFLQVDLAYPLSDGPGAASARAEMIRTTFPRGASFTASGVVVNIERTPEIMPGRVEEDRFIIPVRVRFYAHITGS
jgi:hypothetical protein